MKTCHTRVRDMWKVIQLHKRYRNPARYAQYLGFVFTLRSGFFVVKKKTASNAKHHVLWKICIHRIRLYVFFLYFWHLSNRRHSYTHIFYYGSTFFDFGATCRRHLFNMLETESIYNNTTVACAASALLIAMQSSRNKTKSNSAFFESSRYNKYVSTCSCFCDIACSTVFCSFSVAFIRGFFH